MKVEELEQELSIDLNNLDEAVVRQAQMRHAAGRYLATKISVRDQLKNDLDALAGELFLRFRREMLAENEKPTEGLINARVAASPEMKELRAQHVAACRLANAAQSLERAFGDRTFMLRELCQTYRADYFSSTSERSAAADDVATARRRDMINQQRRGSHE